MTHLAKLTTELTTNIIRYHEKLPEITLSWEPIAAGFTTFDGYGNTLRASEIQHKYGKSWVAYFNDHLVSYSCHKFTAQAACIAEAVRQLPKKATS